jgi:hypothetical protein
MHCPTCGQKQVSEETRFCSRCGFPLTGIAAVIANGGMAPAAKSGLIGTSDSPRRRGVKQGVFLFLLTFLVVPILAMITIALRMEPFLPAMGAFLFGIGGLLRIVYALMFEAGTPQGMPTTPMSVPALSGSESRGSLPPQQSVPASLYVSPAAGSWRDTNELQHQPGSVTDSTTKLLQKDDQ